MDWREDWEAFIAAKQRELDSLDAWIAVKMPRKQHGEMLYDVISADRLLQGLLDQRNLLSREIAEARKYIARKDAV